MAQASGTTGPSNPVSEYIHAEKHRQPNETFREACNRIANALSDEPKHFHTLRNILLARRFLPAGRIQAATGSSRVITAYNCFVSGTIEDSYVEGSGSIMARASQAAATMRLGGGIGYDFSSLRPRGASIKKLGSVSSGPVAFMEIYDAVCRATASSGHRRGAQMAVLRVDHPDVEEFIRAKHDLRRFLGFNVSVAITDEFMRAVLAGTNFTLRWGGQVYREIDARTLWDLIMRSTYDYAEPGVLFIDTINNRNNLNYCETIAATNPCGEQPLPPYGACLLGSFNLAFYLTRQPNEVHHKFDYLQFYKDIPAVVRAMDNVIDRTKYPLYEQEKEALSKRRMGLGVTGVANAIEAMGFPYASPGFLATLDLIMRSMRNAVYAASVNLAKEKGAFPLYSSQYLQSFFIRKLPEELQEDIAKYGIRNSHLLSIAPTGTISLATDNISSGIEPVFSYVTNRTIFTFEGPKQYKLEDYGFKYLHVRGKTANECTVDDHLDVLITASQNVDSAVSKTCNVPKDTSYEDFKKIYLRAWQNGCKGCTTYRVGGKKEAILEAASPEASFQEDNASQELVLASCEVDPTTGRRSCE